MTVVGTTGDAGPLVGGAAVDRVGAIGAGLRRDEALWRPAPFRFAEVPWAADLPELVRWLDTLDEEAVDRLDAEPVAADGPAVWREAVAWSRGVSGVGAWPAPAPVGGSPPEARRIRGRKWDQIERFVAALGPGERQRDGAVVEWCSGRGHLGRLASRRWGRPGLLVEVDPALCGPPAGVAEAEGVRHLRADVLAPDVARQVPDGATLVGLHACGRLGDRLVETALSRDAASLALSPCCPHRRFGDDPWTPLSETVRAHGLPVDAETLRVAVLDEVVARGRRRRLRRRERVWRLAWDLLRREQTGEDRHHKLPSLARGVFQDPLGAFLEARAAERGLVLPAVDLARLEARAEEQALRVRRRGLVRAVYRRPLEVYTALDRVVRLIEAGWWAGVGTFVARAVTPRNLLVRGAPGG